MQLKEEVDVGRWDPEPHLARLRESGRPDRPWIERMAAVLRERMR
jgi:hypothetical protein